MCTYTPRATPLHPTPIPTPTPTPLPTTHYTMHLPTTHAPMPMHVYRYSTHTHVQAKAYACMCVLYRIVHLWGLFGAMPLNRALVNHATRVGIPLLVCPCLNTCVGSPMLPAWWNDTARVSNAPQVLRRQTHTHTLGGESTRVWIPLHYSSCHR